MSKIYRTARGNLVNMDELRSANETRVAAGNMKVNARGDELGSGGHIVRNLADRARAAQKNLKQTKSNTSIKPSITQSEKTIVEEPVATQSEVAEQPDTEQPDTVQPDVVEEFDTEGNITIKKSTKGKNKSESKSTEE